VIFAGNASMPAIEGNKLLNIQIGTAFLLAAREERESK